MPELTIAIICAAGASSRMGGVKKEYQLLDSSQPPLTVLGSSVTTFAYVSEIDLIVIVVPENEKDTAFNALPPEFPVYAKQKVLFVDGGPTRRASVFNALSAIEHYNPRYVLIHDAARPWVSVDLVKKTIENVKKYGAVIPLLPLTDTPKECEAPLGEEVLFIKNHLKRACTGAAQTPQAFRFEEIFAAHKKVSEEKDTEYTDDAEIWGKFCGQVAAIPGSPENRKITFPGDIG
jgi:2-C-methyl-D-erythritol 4-phosphate cytidylyltransferase